MMRVRDVKEKTKEIEKKEKKKWNCRINKFVFGRTRCLAPVKITISGFQWRALCE